MFLTGCGSQAPAGQPAPLQTPAVVAKKAPATVKHVYGWKRASKPSVHPKYSIHPDLLSTPLPPTLDLRSGCPPVYDQGQLGSCTANAEAGLHQYHQIRQGLLPSFVPSRLMLYYGERAMEGTVSTDSGANGDDGIEFLHRTGICPETTWPYNIAEFAVKPPAIAYQQATAHKISGPVTVNGSLVELKTYLVTTQIPIVFGFTAYPELESAQVATSGILPMPTRGEQPIGGHEVMIVGYDDSKQAFLCRNSWGTSWGLSGYFWMPYSYITNSALSGDYRSFAKVAA